MEYKRNIIMLKQQENLNILQKKLLKKSQKLKDEKKKFESLKKRINKQLIKKIENINLEKLKKLQEQINFSKKNPILEDLKQEIEKKNEYDLIYIDPPWDFGDENPKIKGQAITHYKTMSNEDIKTLPINKISSKDALLFFWISSAKVDVNEF